MSVVKQILLLVLCSLAYSIESDGDFLLRAEVQQSASPTPPPEMLVYDDGTPFWFSWAGTYRGVWFSLYDFYPNPINYQIQGAEMWFYHHSEFPWDTSMFFCEAWLGDRCCPIELVASEACIAQQYSAVSCQFDWQPIYPNEFWIILNMEESIGGWPSTLCDNTGSSDDDIHSYYSNDFIVWEPWIIQECHCFPLSMESHSWGNLKTLFCVNL